jgi:hypothetical protein
MYILDFGDKQKALFCSDEASRAALGWDQDTQIKNNGSRQKKVCGYRRSSRKRNSAGQ